MVSVFIYLRSLGAKIGTAWLGQMIVASVCVLTAWKAWRGGMERSSKIVLSLALTFLATPYGYIYDLPCLGLAICGMSGRRGELMAILFTLTIALYIFFAMSGFIVGPLLLAIIAWVAWSGFTGNTPHQPIFERPHPEPG